MSFQYITRILANAIRQVKEIKSVQIRKEKIKLSLFVGNIIVLVENMKESTTTTAKKTAGTNT